MNICELFFNKLEIEIKSDPHFALKSQETEIFHQIVPRCRQTFRNFSAKKLKVRLPFVALKNFNILSWRPRGKQPIS